MSDIQCKIELKNFNLMITAKIIIQPKLTQRDIDLMIYGQTLEMWMMKKRKQYFPNSLKKTK